MDRHIVCGGPSIDHKMNHHCRAHQFDALVAQTRVSSALTALKQMTQTQRIQRTMLVVVGQGLSHPTSPHQLQSVVEVHLSDSGVVNQLPGARLAYSRHRRYLSSVCHPCCRDGLSWLFQRGSILYALWRVLCLKNPIQQQIYQVQKRRGLYHCSA